MEKRGFSESEIKYIIKKYTKRHILKTGVDVEKILAYKYLWGLAYNYLKIELEGLEKVIKEIYDEAKTNRLEKSELIRQLTKRGYTKEKAEQIINEQEQKTKLLLNRSRT